MWQFVCMLPFILDDKLDSDNPYWKVFLSLLEIMGICFAHRVSVSSVINLKRLIKEHLTSFKMAYDARILPKQHYLVHLPTQILMFGPLIRSWCMRFEGKHSYFKDMARKIKNFKNLPLSLAERHQSMESAGAIQIDDEFGDSCPLFLKEIHFGKEKVLLGHDKDYAKNTIARFYDINETNLDAIFQYNSITVHGTHYKTGVNNFLLLGLDDTGLPQFVKLSKIWYAPHIFDNVPNCFFVVMPIKTVIF